MNNLTIECFHCMTTMSSVDTKTIEGYSVCNTCYDNHQLNLDNMADAEREMEELDQFRNCTSIEDIIAQDHEDACGDR